MKKLVFVFFFVITSLSASYAQVDKYILTGGEMIFSFADQNLGQENNLRWSPVFNAQSWHVFDFGTPALFYGLSLRNVGFIVEDAENDIKTKYRTYNVGIPVGLMLDFGEKAGIYGGYEFEVPFHYKQKTFIDGNREERLRSWFSDRTPTFTQSVFFGFQFGSGTNIKFKYYLENFFNQEFTETVDGVETQPYQNFEVNVFYVALTFNAFKGKESTLKVFD
jgi:hypothetical protein